MIAAAVKAEHMIGNIDRNEEEKLFFGGTGEEATRTALLCGSCLSLVGNGDEPKRLKNEPAATLGERTVNPFGK
jgi:hypothetical protein